MAKKAKAKASAGDEFTGTVKESAQQIWLAGLGAFSKAQEQGGKVFEALVKEGLEMQRKTQSATEEKLSEAAGRMTSMANDLTSRATGQWDKLENIFEDRVSRALKKLGVPTAKDMEMLAERIDELNRHLAKRDAKGTKAAKGEATTARKAGKVGTGAKKAAKRAARKSA